MFQRVVHGLIRNIRLQQVYTQIRTMSSSGNPVPLQTVKEDKPVYDDLIRPDLMGDGEAANLKFNNHIKHLIAGGQQIYHFGFGQAPFPVLEHMAEGLKDHVNEAAYLPVAGIPELRSAICHFHKHHDGLTHFNPDDIIVGPGSKQLVFLAMLVFNGDVILMSPTWTTYEPQARLTHHKPVIISTKPEDGWRLTPEAVDKAVEEHNLKKNKMLIFCQPDNPTGTSYNAEQLKALSATFRKHSIIVISDEIYGRLHFTQEHRSLATYYPEGTILSTGMSKWASAGGWRIGYHMYPPALQTLRTALQSSGSNTYSTSPAPMQYAVAKALLDSERCDNYIHHTSRILGAVASFCCTTLSTIGVHSVQPAGGYYLFPDFEVIREGLQHRGIMTGDQMCETMLNECGVALMAGGPAYLRPVEELTTRMCYVNFDGASALTASRKIGLELPLPDDFVKTYCRPVYDGILALVQWVEEHKD